MPCRRCDPSGARSPLTRATRRGYRAADQSDDLIIIAGLWSRAQNDGDSPVERGHRTGDLASLDRSRRSRFGDLAAGGASDRSSGAWWRFPSAWSSASATDVMTSPVAEFQHCESATDRCGAQRPTDEQLFREECGHVLRLAGSSAVTSGARTQRRRRRKRRHRGVLRVSSRRHPDRRRAPSRLVVATIDPYRRETLGLCRQMVVEQRLGDVQQPALRHTHLVGLGEQGVEVGGVRLVGADVLHSRDRVELDSEAPVAAPRNPRGARSTG